MPNRASRRRITGNRSSARSRSRRRRRSLRSRRWWAEASRGSRHRRRRRFFMRRQRRRCCRHAARANSLMSAPAQKCPPAPVRIASRRFPCRSASVSPKLAASYRRHAARSSALRRACRSIETTATVSSRRETRISDTVARPLRHQEGGPQAAARGREESAVSRWEEGAGRAAYRNPIESHGIAATMISEPIRREDIGPDAPQRVVEVDPADRAGATT